MRNKKRLILPAFNFDNFEDEINVKAGEIRWKNLLDMVGRCVWYGLEARFNLVYVLPRNAWLSKGMYFFTEKNRQFYLRSGKENDSKVMVFEWYANFCLRVS